eukprot:7026559-Prymnesium_polylepis.1
MCAPMWDRYVDKVHVPWDLSILCGKRGPDGGPGCCLWGCEGSAPEIGGVKEPFDRSKEFRERASLPSFAE